MKRYIDDKYQELLDTIAAMTDMVGTSLQATAHALMTGDLEAAEQVVAGDEKIDAYENLIEAECWRLLALEQPVACDLRLVYSAAGLAGNLERIGDYQVIICRNILRSQEAAATASGDDEFSSFLASLPDLYVRAVAAWFENDAATATEIVRLEGPKLEDMADPCVDLYGRLSGCVIAQSLERTFVRVGKIAASALFKSEGLLNCDAELAKSHSALVF